MNLHEVLEDSTSLGFDQHQYLPPPLFPHKFLLRVCIHPLGFTSRVLDPEIQ